MHHHIPIPPASVPTRNPNPNPNPNHQPLCHRHSSSSSSSSSSVAVSVIIGDVAAPAAAAIIRPPLAIPLSSPHAIIHHSSPPRPITNSPSSSSADSDPPIPHPPQSISRHSPLPPSSSPTSSRRKDDGASSLPLMVHPEADHRYCSEPPLIKLLSSSSSSALLIDGNSDHINPAADPARRTESAVITDCCSLPSCLVSGSHNLHENQPQQQNAEERNRRIPADQQQQQKQMRSHGGSDVIDSHDVVHDLQQQQQQDQIVLQTLSQCTSTDPVDLDRSLQSAGGAAAEQRRPHLLIDPCNYSDSAISDRCNNHNNDLSEDEDASAEDPQHLIYALRRNPKRNRRFSDRDSAAATTTGGTEMMSMAIDNHHNKFPLATAEDDQHQNQITTSSAAAGAAGSNDRDPDCNRSLSTAFSSSPNRNYAALGGAPERISQNSPVRNDNNNKNNNNQQQQQQQLRKSSSVFSSLQEKTSPACSECGKEFQSWKALFGHMRCHPERDWRGIQPPPARHSSNAFDTRKIITKNHHGIRRSCAGAVTMAPSRTTTATTTSSSIAAAAPLDHFPPPKPAAIFRSGNIYPKKAAIIAYDHDPCKPIVVMNDGSMDRNRREAASDSPRRRGCGRDVHVQYWDGQEVSLEEEEESETESIEAAYLSCSSGSKDNHNNHNHNNIIIKSGKDVDPDPHKSSHDALLRVPQIDAAASSDYSLYPVVSSQSSMAPTRGKRSRRSHPTLKSLKSMEFADDLQYSTSATKCKINPIVAAADYSRASRDGGRISDEVEMANCLIMLALAGSFVEMKEEEEEEEESEEEEEEDVDSINKNSEMDPALREKQQRKPADSGGEGRDKTMRECGRRRRRRNSVMEVDDVEAETKRVVGEDVQRFECGTCRKVFRSHQALGGHRASHKKVKGCFARAPVPVDNMAEEEEGGGAGNSAAAAAAAEAPDLQDGGADGRSPESGEHVIVDYYYYSSSSEWSLQKQQQENMEDQSVAAAHHHHGAAGAAPAVTSTKLLSSSSSNKSHQCSICFRVFSSGQALGGHKRCHWSADKSGGAAAESSAPAAAAAANSHNRNSITTDRLPFIHPESVIKSSGYSCKSIKVDLDLNLPAPPDFDHDEYCASGRSTHSRRHSDYRHHLTHPSQLLMFQDIIHADDASHGKSAAAPIAGHMSLEVYNGRHTNRFGYAPTTFASDSTAAPAAAAAAPFILLDSPSRSAAAQTPSVAVLEARDHFENAEAVSAIIDSSSNGPAAAQLAPCIPV